MQNDPDKKIHELDPTYGKMALAVLVVLSAFFFFREPKLGATQKQTEDSIIASVESEQSAELNDKGKYKRTGWTQVDTKTSYKVDEWVKGQGEAYGYTIYIETTEDKQQLSPTTSKMEIVSVKNIKKIER